MSTLFPEGITDLRDLPYTLHEAIVAALHFLGFEEWPKDERPDKSIWLDNKEMKKHAAKVERMRDEKYGGDKKGDIRDEEIEGPVSQNDTEALLGVKR